MKSLLIAFVLSLAVHPLAHAEPCDTSLVKIMAGAYVPYTGPSVDIQQGGGEAFYDAATGTVFSKTVWDGMYSNIVDMKKSYRLNGPSSVDPLPVGASLRITGYSVGQCAPHSTCEPGYASMSITRAAVPGYTNVIHEWLVGQNIDKTGSLQAQVVPGAWFQLRIYLQTGVMGGPGSVTVQNAQATFVLPDGYVLETCEGATFAPPPPGPVDVPLPPRGTLALRALGANPGRDLPAFVCDIPSDGAGRFVLCDLAGRIVRQQNLGWLSAGTHRIDPAGEAALAPGVYWAQLSHAGVRTRQKLVIVGR